MERSLSLILSTILLGCLSGCIGQSSADDDFHPGIGVPRIVITETASFNAVYVGASSSSSFQITNQGGNPATAISLTTSNDAYAITASNCGSTLNPGVSCSITVEFTPQSAALSLGGLQVQYRNGPESPQKTATHSMSASAAAGDSLTLDTQTFGGGNGYVLNDMGTNYWNPSKMLYLPDGKIIIGGAVGNGPYDSTLARFNSDGTLDTSFDGDGILTLDLTGTNENDVISDMAVQSDGKIVVVGYVTSGMMQSLWMLARFNSDGTFDSDFGTGGLVTHSVGAMFESLSSVVVLSNGKILVTGSARVGGNYDIALARFNPDGSLDTDFDGDSNGNGIVTTPVGAGSDGGIRILVQSDGKIVVVGESLNMALRSLALVRYNEDGSLDTSFDSDGKVTATFGVDTRLTRGVIQPDGKIVVAGRIVNGFDWDFAVMRFNADGSVDTDFDDDGKVNTSFTTGMDYASDVHLQSDGKILLIGVSYTGSYADSALVRYHSDGSLDTSFDGDGMWKMDIGGYGLDDWIGRPLVQPDGKLLFVGQIDDGVTDFLTISRFWP